jgi:DNA-directed RNA polymerase specialized sigma24 family protein
MHRLIWADVVNLTTAVEVLLALSNPPKEFMSLADMPPKPGRQQKSSRAPRQAQTHLNEDERVELLERYLSGERAHVLARAFNLDRRTVASILVRAGVRRARSMTEDERIEAARLYAEGWSCQQIGEQMGRDHGTVWLALKGAGVQLRQPWVRATLPASVANQPRA